MKSFILARASQLLFPVTMVFALSLLLRGHDAPGGGFSAGLVTSLALVIEAFALGTRVVRRRVGSLLRPAFWIGLILAVVAAVGPMLAGEPFLTHHHVTVLGVPLATTLLFDTGVYAIVVGTTVAVLAAVAPGEPS